MSGARVAITGVTHSFAARCVLDDVSATLASGTITALLGPSGCGKSTLLRIVAGLLRPDAGTLSINGSDALGTPGRAAFMPQGDALLPWLRALDNATLPRRIAGEPRAVADAAAQALFARFGLAGFESAWPRELSGGMRQRVALLRAVLTDAELLLLDEPFGALDAITRMDLHGWLTQLLVETGRTTLFVTHDVDEALRLAGHILVMSPRPGPIVEQIAVPDPADRSVQRLHSQDFAIVKHRVLVALAQP